MSKQFEAISLKLPDDLLQESDRLAGELNISRAEYIRTALEESNRRLLRQARRQRMQDASRRVRGESMKVNEQFAAVERDLGA